MATRSGGRPEETTRPFRVDADYILAVVLSWLVPGAGHWMLGRRGWGAFLGALLLGTFWWGEVSAGGYAVYRKEHPIWFFAQVGNGASALVANGLQWAEIPPPPAMWGGKMIDRNIPTGLQMGILLSSVSGVLNVLLILEVMDPRTWERRRRREQRAGGSVGLSP